MKTNYIEKNIDKLLSTWLFKEKTLKKWEALFNIWDIDNNLYYIKNWVLSVWIKWITENNKEIAILEKGNITWEWSLFNPKAKKASITAKSDSKLLYMNIEKDMDTFFIQNPILWKELLIYLLSIEHDRINNLNFHISANYEINSLIRDIWEINKKSIYKVIDWFKEIIKADRILYLEKNENITDIIKLSYDTNFEWRTQIDKIYDKENEKNIINLREIYESNNINESKENIYINDISIWNFILWYFILIRNDKPFSDNDQKVISWITNSFWGLIKQYKNQQEDKNRLHLMGY